MRGLRPGADRPGATARLMRRLALITAGCLAVCSGHPANAEDPVSVSNGTHETAVLRVAMTDSLHNGMVQPPSAGEAFLLVFLETDDPCFDPTANADCFDGDRDRDELETIAWACGEVDITTTDSRSADGGGLLGGELACSYVVPISTAGLVLRLRGYPEIGVEPRD